MVAVSIEPPHAFIPVQILSGARHRFEEGHLEPGGPIYDCWMEGKKIVIRYNVDHPFYQRFLIENSSDASALLSVDFLIFSLASAELRAKNDENAQIIESFRFDMSTNLRALLSN
jgi:hypothetical protein